MRPVLALPLAFLVLAAPAGTALVPFVDDALAANPWLDRRPLNMAHQGGEFEAPSDTLYAFKTALAKGADVLEMDVHMTADGHIVVLHDATVDRTTNGAGRVDALTLAEIKALDAAHWFVPDVGTTHTADAVAYAFRGIATGAAPAPIGFTANDFTIPTLREVLEAFPSVLLNVEIKNTAPDTAPYEAALADLLREFERSNDTIVVSFLDHATEAFRVHAPGTGVSTAPGTGGVAAFWASAAGAAPGAPLPHHALQVPVTYEGVPVVTADFVADAHANGLAVHVWTVNDRDEMEWLLDLGVDGIMTDVPTVLEDVLATRAAAAE